MTRLGRETLERTLTPKQRILLARIRKSKQLVVRGVQIQMARDIARLGLITLDQDVAGAWRCKAVNE